MEKIVRSRLSGHGRGVRVRRLVAVLGAAVAATAMLTIVAVPAGLGQQPATFEIVPNPARTGDLVEARSITPCPGIFAPFRLIGPDGTTLIEDNLQSGPVIGDWVYFFGRGHFGAAGIYTVEVTCNAPGGDFDYRTETLVVTATGAVPGQPSYTG